MSPEQKNCAVLPSANGAGLSRENPVTKQPVRRCVEEFCPANLGSAQSKRAIWKRANARSSSGPRVFHPPHNCRIELWKIYGVSYTVSNDHCCSLVERPARPQTTLTAESNRIRLLFSIRNKFSSVHFSSGNAPSTLLPRARLPVRFVDFHLQKLIVCP